MDIAVGLVQIFGILVASYGILSWRLEFRGKRHIELAEDTLALLYEVRDCIKSIRNSFVLSGEYSNIKQNDDESDDNFNARQDSEVIFNRIRQHQEILNNLHAKRYRFMAHLGEHTASPFDDIRKAVDKIYSSALSLARLRTVRNFRDDVQEQIHCNKIIELEEIIQDYSDGDDVINNIVNQAILDIETICKPILRSGQLGIVGCVKLLWVKRRRWIR